MRPKSIALAFALGTGLGSLVLADPPPRPNAVAVAVAEPVASPAEAPVRGGRARPTELPRPTAGGVPDALPTVPGENLSTAAAAPATPEGIGGQSLSLQAALSGTITSNPDLVTLRQTTASGPSAEAVEVARRFPTTLNPTLFIDYRPITLIPRNPLGSTPAGSGETSGTSGKNQHGFYRSGQNYFLISLRQPIELGHQTTHRYGIARAAYSQQRWNLLQAELTAIVQTYRLYQTAAYRREKYRVAQQLADFNARLLQTLQRRAEAAQVQAADVALAKVESRATRQMVKAARQDYLTALADLGNIIGAPESAAAREPLGEFTLPSYIPAIDEQAMIQMAMQSRPDIHAAQAQLAGTDSAVKLAKGDRIPTPVIGPQYVISEAGVQYIGLVYFTSLPIFNNGKPLVRQREAEHRRAITTLHQVQQRAVAQVRSATSKWNGAIELVNDSSGLSAELQRDVGTLQRLFNEGQADLTKLMQGRQRLIQLENARLDSVWAATQAQADLLLALGAPALIDAFKGLPAAPAVAPRAAPAR